MGNLCEREDLKNDHNCTVSFIQTFQTSNRDSSDPTAWDFIMNSICVGALMVFTIFKFRK